MDDGEQGVKILMVDDRPANLMSLRAILEDQPGYELILASSGEEALDRVLREDFAVILLDVAMPQMDGFETARLIKQRERSCKIPIIFITASVYDMENIYRGYTVGAVDYLPKPVDPHAVRAKVAVFVELHLQAREIERQARLLQEIQAREQERLRRQANEAMAEKRRAEVARDASEARFRRLQESGLVGIFFWQLDGRVVDANEAFLCMVGFSEDELRAGHINWRELTPPECDAADGRALAELQATSVCQMYEKEFVRRDGGRVSVLLGSAFLDGPEEGGLSFALDITQRKQVESERARLVRELRQAVRVRDDFLSIAAHELKTPLTPLRIQTESILRAIRKDECERVELARLARRLEVIQRSVVRMERLIESLLDVSRVTRGKLELEFEEFDLMAAARGVVERMREELDRAGCTLSVEGDTEVVGRWDRLRIEQIVENLLSNAVKYGAGKPIKLVVERDERAPYEAARISVQDHGIGIAKEAQARIFDKFERVAPMRHFGGLGLGLWIVQQIVQAHGGEIAVESELEQGARFTVTLPLALRAEATRAPAGASAVERHASQAST
ncbi:MAG TPA: ATP-binding protein [Polyangia bacterium]|nr:ATP-binding protein [Polyangia bacterium]